MRRWRRATAIAIHWASRSRITARTRRWCGEAPSLHRESSRHNIDTRPRGGHPARWAGGSAREVRRISGDPGLPDRRHISNGDPRSEEHTSELQSLMRISYAVFCLKKKNTPKAKVHNK